MSTWTNALAAKIKAAPSTVASARKFYTKYGRWVDRYHGGVPVGFLCATAALESNGTMVAGDPSYGEFGFFQIATHTEGIYGLPKDFRKTPEGNIFLAGLEYNVEAKRLQLKYPEIVIDGTKDQWLLARLVFAFGNHGADVCIQAAVAHGSVVRGRVFEGIVRWADETGAIKIGGSVAEKIWYRIHMLNDVNWPVGAAVTTQYMGVPHLPPAPAGVRFSIPADVRGKISSGSTPLIVAALVAGAALLV